MEDTSKVNRLLMFAVERADHREIERLLQNGADPNYYNSCAANGKCTPLHVAIVVADPVTVRMLLRKGANRDTTNSEGLSPLDMAQLLEYSEIASLLINHSKEPSSEDGPQTSKWFYTRRSGTSSIAGQMYEYKLLALVLLRLKKGPYQFLLGSNITGIGNFDDLCVRYRQVGETSFKYLFIQAKHREDPKRGKKKVTKELLLNLDCKDSSEYSMHKHFEQYLKIREQFTKTSNDEFFAGNFENLNIEFVLYTTAHSDLETNDQINSEFLLETSADGKVYMVESTDEIIQSLCAHVNEAKVEQTWKNEKQIEKSGFKQKLAIDFLNKFRVYHSQAMEHEVGEIVGAELDGKSDSWQLLNLIYLDLVQKYWMRKDKIVYLTEFCRFLEEAEQIVADTSLLSHLTSIFFNKVKSFELIFSNDAIVELNLDSFLSDCSRIFLNIHSNAPEISFANICQNMMQRFGNNLAVIDFEKIDDFSKVFSEFLNSNSIKYMVIHCKANTRKLREYLSSSVQKFRKKIIIASDEPFHWLQGCENKFDHMNGMANLTVECQESILHSKSIIFQNTEVKLFDIVGSLQDVDHVPRKWIAGGFLFKLLTDNLFIIASVSAKPIEYFVKRKLCTYNHYTKTIENVDSFDEHVVIIAAEPGMGKSTLLTELTKHNESVWIVRYNLLDFTGQLSKMNRVTIDLGIAIKFILHTLGMPETSVEFQGDKIRLKFVHSKENFDDSMQMFELKVFERYYNLKKVIVFADGFDEIAPQYMSSVIQLLNIFKNCNIRKLLVTTRDTSVSIELEKQLNVRAYSLEPFSFEDILDFCKKFWELNLNLQTKLNTKRVKEFVNAVTETYNVYRYDFISIPLHTEMIARCIQEKFELFYKHKDVRYTRVPDYTLNGYSLFKDFIDIKYDDIYLKDKNKIDPTLPICLLDGGLKESFYNRHKRLALCALFDRDIIDLLSPETFYKLPNDLRTVQHGKERCGFVCRFEDDKPQFTHLSFAEFFVADVIWERFRLISSSQLMTLLEKVLKGYLITNDKQQICIFLQGFAMHEPNNIKDSSAKARFLLRNLTFESGKKSNNCMLSLIDSCLTDNCSDVLQVLDGLSVGEKRAIFTLSAQEGYTNLLRAMNGMIGQAIMKKQKCYFELLSQTKEDENMKTANILVNEHGYGINWTFACNTTCFSGLMKYNSYAMIKSFLNSGFKEFVNPCGKFSLPLYDVLERIDAPQDLIETLLNATDLTLIEQHFFPKISWLLLSRDQSLTEAFLQKGIDMVQVFLVEQERGVWDGAWSVDYFYYLLSLRWMNQMQLFFENGVGFHTKLLAKVKKINYIFNSILSASETDQNLANVCINALIRSKNAKSFRLVVRSTCFDKTLYINNRTINVDKFMSRTIFNIETSNFEEIFELLNCKDLPNASQNFNNFISEVLNSNEEVLSFEIIKHICLTHFIDAKDFGELVSKLSIIVPMLEKLHSHYLKLFDAIQTRQQNYVKHELISIQSEMHRKTIINGRSETFGSPLFYVVTTNDTTMAELLLDYGANPNIVLYHEKDQKCDKFTQLYKKYMEYDNITSVHVAACLGNLEIIKLLHAKGANIHPKTSITPLHLAAREGHIEIVRYLLNNDAEADAKTFNYNRSSIAKDDEGRTPLELAQQNGRTGVVTLLKRYQPSLANGFTELHRAAASNDLDELRILVQAGTIAINSRTTYNGYTPLHVGAEHGYAAVVLFLLKNRADKNARSLQGKTPLEIALEKRHNKVADTINLFQLSDFQQSYIPDFRRIKKEEEIYLQKNGGHSCG